MSKFDEDEDAWTEQELAAGRKSEAKAWLAKQINETQGRRLQAFPYELEDDVDVHGGIQEIAALWAKHRETYEDIISGVVTLDAHFNPVPAKLT